MDCAVLSTRARELDGAARKHGTIRDLVRRCASRTR